MTSTTQDMFKQTCRTCLSTNGEMVSIFSSSLYVNQIPKKLMAFTNVEILVNDNLPKTICKKCIFMADSFYCFKEQCEYADKKLKLLSLKKNPNKDYLLNAVEKKLQKATSGFENFGNEANNVVNRSQETEDNYSVEYISDDVKVEVENATKRRQEAEKRICFEKVSQSIKNLKGIEVVPVGDCHVARHEKNIQMDKEEIVLFPIDVTKERCARIETIVIDDPPAPKKRFRLPSEITVSRINESYLKPEVPVIYRKHTKLNFSTVRKIVKIDDKELCIETKQETSEELSKEDSQNKYDAGIILRTDDNSKLNSRPQYTEIEIDKKAIEINPEMQNSETITVSQESINTPSSNGISNLENDYLVEKSTIDSTISNNNYTDHDDNHQQIDGEDVRIIANTNDNRISFFNDRTDKSNEFFIQKDPKDPNLGYSNSETYECSICSINFFSMPIILKHNIQEHMAEESPFVCLICDKNFYDKPSLCEHVEEHNGSKPYTCTVCPKTFTLQRNLKRHIDDHINYKPLECHICTKRFREKSSLKSHMYLHTGDSPFACKSCNVSFNNKTNWRRHIVTIHEKLTVVVCDICRKEFPDKRSLRVHTRVHTGDRPYHCPYCKKKFTQQCNLNSHIHCHLNDRRFGCPHCGKGFNQRGTRDDHILTHTGERPHKCINCEASFTVASALKRHMWIHTDKDRPYNCEKCRLQFVGLYELRRHLKIRHGEIIKPDNPRVERVLTNHANKDTELSGILGKSEFDYNNSGATDTVQSYLVIESNKLEIAAKENSSLSCNINKVEVVQSEEIEKKVTKTNIEDCNNRAQEELSNNSQILAADDVGSLILDCNINKH